MTYAQVVGLTIPVATWINQTYGATTTGSIALAITVWLVFQMPAILIAFLTYGLLTRWLRPKFVDTETRCRKCNYILRGITEPRCPECGERI